MSRQLFILISTLDERIIQVRNIIQKYDKNINYIVSHQISKKLNSDSEKYGEEISLRDDVVYSQIRGQGVARNRNNTLKFIEPLSICVILDDDIVLYENSFSFILQSFDDNPGVDFISFKISDLQGNDYKPYPKNKQWHTLRTLTGIGTTEIAFKSDLVFNTDISFDERFGPGSDRYPIGEDFIFTMDLYKLKTKMLFLPIPIVKHPKGSTGDNLDRSVIFGRGAMFARVFGWKAFLINIFFSVKKYADYHKEMSIFSYLTHLNQGTMHYFRSSKKKVLCKN